MATPPCLSGGALLPFTNSNLLHWISRMKSQKIQEMSSEALLKRKKTTEFATGVLAGMLMVLLVMAIHLCFTKSFSVGLPLLIVPLSLSSIVLISVADVKAVKRELQTRN